MHECCSSIGKKKFAFGEHMRISSRMQLTSSMRNSLGSPQASTSAAVRETTSGLEKKSMEKGVREGM
jgi:hypothetical protein